jgi:apolipoprotein N-acyltransferase
MFGDVLAVVGLVGDAVSGGGVVFGVLEWERRLVVPAGMAWSSIGFEAC